MAVIPVAVFRGWKTARSIIPFSESPEMRNEPEQIVVASTTNLEPATTEERLRQRVSMLTQLLIVAGVVVMLQFGIMLKVLRENSK